jgi:urea transport system substrate-binding protein
MSYAFHMIIRDQLKAIGGSSVGEAFVEIDGHGVAEMVAAIKASGADVVINSVAGEANKEFFHQLTQAGLPPSRMPVVSISVSEDELRQLPVSEMVGDYAAWGYFQSIDRKENVEFVKKFQERYEGRPTSDSIASAYGSVMLWKQAVEEADTAETSEVRKYLRRQSRNAPEGVVSVDYDTLHTWRPFYLGKIRPDGQFDVVLSLTKPIRPVPFPMFRAKTYWLDAMKTWNDKGKADAPPSSTPPSSSAPPPSSTPPPPSGPPQASTAPRVWGVRGVVSAADGPPRSAALDRPSVTRTRPTTR